MAIKLSKSEVIKRFKAKHGDNYDYSLVNYVNRRTKIDIICPKHGIFHQTPDKHYDNGCPKCWIEKLSELKSISQDEVIRKCIHKHGSKYAYDKVNYVDSKTKITITCPIHGDFEQLPTNHYHSGHDCPKCANIDKAGGYGSLSVDNLKSISNAYMYCTTLNHDCEIFDKIGVTINPNSRFANFGKYRVIDRKMIKFSSMYEAYTFEQKLHKKYTQYRYFPKFKFGGYTECYKNGYCGY